VRPHQIFATAQAQHENKDERQQHSAGNLRKQDDGNLRAFAQRQDRQRTQHNERRIQKIKCRGLIDPLVDARFESQTFAYRVGGSQGKGGSRKKRCIAQTKGEDPVTRFTSSADSKGIPLKDWNVSTKDKCCVDAPG
jgi:hypothetical protein